MPRRRSGKKIDFVHWTGLQESADAFSAGTVAKTAHAAQHDPETLLRFRGNLNVLPDATQIPGGSVEIGVGLILVPEGTGTTVLWSPNADPDAPWIYYSQFGIAYEEMVTDVIAVQGAMSFRERIDNKAMRVVRNQEVQFVVENTTIQGAMAVNVLLTGRTLWGT